MSSLHQNVNPFSQLSYDIFINGLTHILICGFLVSYTFPNSVMLISKIREHNVRAGRWEMRSHFGECEQEVADYNCEVQFSK